MNADSEHTKQPPEIKELHFCQTCKHVHNRVIDEPCKSCLPEHAYPKWESNK